MHPEIDVAGGFRKFHDHFCDAVREYGRLHVDVEGLLSEKKRGIARMVNFMNATSTLCASRLWLK